MKKIPLFLLALSSFLSSWAFSVDKIDPPFWWTGMKDSSLQLQIYGKDIKAADFSVDYPGVTIDSIARLDGSPNWQFVYLNISPKTQPGEMTLKWKEGNQVIEKEYSLKPRKEQKGAQGFSSADVLYLIMPDRFADGDTTNNVVETMAHPSKIDRNNPNVRHGGDIKGILDNIDYLDSLGITAVWVNPVLENDMPGGSYHGYATTDYYAIDPRFGSNDEYVALIDSLHGKGIKMVMDMIFNHSGIAHPWISDLPASDWLNLQDNYKQTNYRLSTINDPYVSDYDKMLTTDGWFVYGMPDLNQNNPHLMKYLIQNSIWWIENSQIDGIRMDTYAYADKDRMGEWIEAVEREYPDFNIVGECWLGDVAGVAKWQSGSPLANGYDTKLKTVMDFPLMTLSENLAPFKAQTDPWNGLNKIYDHFALDYVYADPNKVLRFLDNHDTDRVIKEDIEDLGPWKQAIALLLTTPGIPQLYYGTELLMSGTREGGDGNIRKDMPGGFPGDSVSVFTPEGRTPLQNEAFDFISSINKWRRSNTAAANGSFKHFMPTNGIYLFERKNDKDSYIVVMNGRDEENEVEMERYQEIIEPGRKYKDILTGEIIILRPVTTDSYVFSPREIRILEPID
ncbi:MAG: glycoside hydrolase family 13 protein [Muribaculaceae bacterium]|nr:glycoside hydrolase family 13 protein [Muribaculaceae bacterium]